jgi:murein DD-endopeptidase MepM/ murein hydrolase activator NlpD
MSSKKKAFLCIFLFLLIFFFGKENPQKENVSKNSNFLFLGPKAFFQENSGFLLSQNLFLKPDISPIQIFSKSLATLQESRREIVEYEVKEGDTISSISQKFSLSKETVIWANNLSENSKLKVGEKLIILPVDGVLHQVKKGETLSEIAKKYKANLKDIVYFNEISEDQIFPGDILIIPGGKMPPSQKFVQSFLPISSSFFICPLPPCNITQGLHWYNAVDFSNGRCGEYVLAAASGKVIFARYGWNGGAGNTIKILHPNGIITQYGHLREILVKVGQEIYQGQIVGTVGNTGRVVGITGCHLHFAVLGAKNPFANY